MHRDDFAGERAQIADLMNQVDEDRPAAGFASPRRGIEVIGGLVEHRAAGDRDQSAERACLHDLASEREDRAMRAMMADEESRVDGLR